MKENILICLIFLACAFSAGVMVAGGLLPDGVLYGVIGGLVLVSIMGLFVGGLLGVVWLFKRAERPQHPEPYRDYRPYPDRAIQGQFDRPGIDHQHVHRWPTIGHHVEDRRELPTPERDLIRWKK